MFTNRTLTETDLKILKQTFPDDYEEKIKRIKNGYPIQYIIGNVDFLNTCIEVNDKVLIPRFETEYLVEKVLNRLKQYEKSNLNIIDLCTGSGCIAIALAKNTNFACTAIDISKDALEVAKKNSTKNNVDINFYQLDILKENNISDFDIVISNPPYIAIDENIDPSTKYEPSLALYAKEEGCIFYKKILENIKNTPKLIAFEIGETQGQKIKKLAELKFPQAKINIEKDLCGKERYIFIENK